MKFKYVPFIALALISFLIFSCVQEPGQPLSQEASRQIALLPGDAAVYGYVNIKRLHNAEFSHSIVDSIKKHSMHHSELNEFIEQTGLDPQKDIESVYFAAKPKSESNAVRALFIAQGNYQPDKILDYIKANDDNEKLHNEPFKEYTLYFTEERKFAFCFADNNTLVGGAKEQVKTWLDQRQIKEDVPVADEALLRRIESLKYKKGMWVTLNPQIWKKQFEIDEFRKLKGLKDLKNFGFSLDLSDKLQLSATGDFSDAEKAALFEDAVRGAVSAGKLAVSDDRTVIDILNNVDIKIKNNRVEVEFEMSDDDLQKLIKRKEALSRMAI